MNIANQGFPATRADLNNALQAIATNNSGTSAPSTTFANQWFYNETSNKLFIRNEANNAFIEVATLDQTNNEWQITTGVIQAKDGDGLALKTDDGTTRLFVKDSDGFIGIGTSSPETLVHLSSGSGSTGSVLRLESTDTSVGDGQQVGAIEFESNDASTGGSGISSKISSVSNSTFGTSYAQKFEIGYVTGGGHATKEIIRLDFDGIKFNGDTAAANALNYYEEGSWSPASANFSSNPLTVNGTGNRYTRIGRQVFAYFDITWNSGNSSSAQAIITGLPFQPSAEHEGDGAATIGFVTGANGVDFTIHASNSATQMAFFGAGSPSSQTYANFANRRIAGYILYYTDA